MHYPFKITEAVTIGHPPELLSTDTRQGAVREPHLLSNFHAFFTAYPEPKPVQGYLAFPASGRTAVRPYFQAFALTSFSTFLIPNPRPRSTPVILPPDIEIAEPYIPAVIEVQVW